MGTKYAIYMYMTCLVPIRMYYNAYVLINKYAL